MARYAGTALYVKFGSTVLTGDHKAFKTSEKADQIDATGGADTYKTWLAGVRDGDCSMNLMGTTGGTAIYNAVAPGVSGTLEWAPEGTAAGKQKWTCSTAVVVSRDADYPYDGVVSYDVGWKLNATVTGGTY